jgi:large subunit ribosomal protein L23
MKLVLKKPVLTEKARELAKKNQFVFIVEKSANKNEIKKAIENFYKVEVLDVKILKIPSKPRRLGRISGERKEYKKAIVKIKEGQKIEVMSQ